MALKDELEKARRWAYNNLAGKKVYQKDIDDFIHFNKAGISHAIYARTYKEKIQLIYNAEKLIASSTLYSSELDKKGRPDIKAVHKFVTNWEFKGKDYFVYIVVRETTKKFYYDHGIIKEKP